MSGGSSVNRLAIGAIGASLLVIAAVAVLHFARPGAEGPGNGMETGPAANEVAEGPGGNTVISFNTSPTAPANQAEPAPPPPSTPPRDEPRRPTPAPPRPTPAPPGPRPPEPPGPYVPPPSPPPVARPPRLIAGAITARDYPSEAEQRGVGGTTGARLTIGPNGRVTNCTITASSGSGALDRTTCNLAMRRYRYAPALDAQGRPTTATIPLRVTWRL